MQDNSDIREKKFTETKWVKEVQELTRTALAQVDTSLEIRQGANLPYASEVRAYRDGEPDRHDRMAYETDLLVVEVEKDGCWKPRVVIECKIQSITTHDAITYSEKALNHKRVHPYLRYGVLLGKRGHYPLPGRLFRHGLAFDFMLSWQSQNPTKIEFADWMKIILAEVEASRTLEEMLYSSRKPTRKRYNVFHKPLVIK